MTGSLQIKNEKWYVVTSWKDGDKWKTKWHPTDLDAGTNDKKDKKRLKNIREATKMKNDIVQVELDKQTELAKPKMVYTSDILFVDWIDKWMEGKKLDVYQSTYDGYEYIVRAHIRPYFDELKEKPTLSTIKPQNIKDYYTAMQNEGLSINTVKHHKVVLNSAVEQAVDFEIVPYNIVSRVKLKKTPRYEGKSYTEEQALNLLSVINDEPLKPCIILGLFYGLRRSEILGLRWQDIDFNKDVIHIRLPRKLSNSHCKNTNRVA